MSHQTSLHLPILPDRSDVLKPVLPGSESAVAARRDRIWDLSSNLHCSIVGTCLSDTDLRHIFSKLKALDARTMSDHELHSRAVRAAGTRDVAGKLLNKALDKKHAAHLKRFARASDVGEVRTLWRAALEEGDVSGAYWAVMTHPLADKDLVREAFGDVHMLSHLIGKANRVDIARLRRLERELSERDEKIVRQEERLRRAARDKADLVNRLSALEAQLREHALCSHPALAAAAGDPRDAVERKLADARARLDDLSARIAAQEDAIRARDVRVMELERQKGDLQSELSSLDGEFERLAKLSQEPEPRRPDLDDLTVLYVGGRPKLVEQLRVLTARWGGVLLDHDGGLEHTSGLLPGLVSQADVAFFPVDCVSHLAAGQIKRLCREAQKPFVPLRSASLASFIAALSQLEDGAEANRTRGA